MSTMLIANNCTRESGSFMGDQLCGLKACYLFVENQPDVNRVIMSVSHTNEMHFLWEKFIDKYDVDLIWDDWNPGDWATRWEAWDRWRTSRSIEGIKFDHYRELHLRIHGAQRQYVLCGSERGLGRRNIYSYWYCGQEHCPDELPPSVDWFDDSLIHHPPHAPERDVYISPHAKTQGNVTFTFQFWDDVVRRLIDAGVTVTVGYEGDFCNDLHTHPFYRRYWGDHRQWMEEVCRHKLVACGNTGTGWLAAACGVPMITMEPPNSVMADHRYRECGLRNIAELVREPDAEYVAARIAEYVGGNIKMLGVTGIYREAAHYSVNPHEKLVLLAKELGSVSHLDGDVADLGSYRGGSALVMRRVAPDKDLHLVDTWEGTPYDDDLCHHKSGEWVASLDSCRALVGNGDKTHYHKCVFPQGVGGLKDRRFCLVYVDMDTYQATKDAIDFFWPLMVPGGKMLFDDYSWEPCAGVKKAVDESLRDGWNMTVIPSSYTFILEKE